MKVVLLGRGSSSEWDRGVLKNFSDTKYIIQFTHSGHNSSISNSLVHSLTCCPLCCYKVSSVNSILTHTMNTSYLNSSLYSAYLTRLSSSVIPSSCKVRVADPGPGLVIEEKKTHIRSRFSEKKWDPVSKKQIRSKHQDPCKTKSFSPYHLLKL